MKKGFIFILLLLMTLTLNGCLTVKHKESLIVKDLTNREVEIVPGSYKRVVCIGAGALRLYAYINGSNLLAGVEDIENETLSVRPKMFDGVARPYFMQYKDDYKNLPSCGVGGPNAQSAEAEKILNCNPDIIISEYSDVAVADALYENIGVPVINLSYGSEGVFDARLRQSLLLLGTIFDREERAQTIVDFIESEKQEIANRTKDVEEKPLVYIAGLGNWGTTNHLMTASKYAPFEVAHISNVIENMNFNGIQKIDEEKFLEIAPNIDIMILDAASIKNIKPLYQEDPTMFDTCKAWNNGEVYLQMAYNVYYTNVEIALANTWFSAISVYPTLFSDIDITDKLNEITNVFLGNNLANEIYAYPNSFSGYQKIDVNNFFN